MDFARVPRISWYPGHMLKAERELADKLSAVDLIVELVDARAPATTRNYRFADHLDRKAAVVLLGKGDLAHPPTTQAWLRHFQRSGLPAASYHHRLTGPLSQLHDLLLHTARTDGRCRWARERFRRPLRVVVIGLPNVGKSTLTNLLAGRRRAKTGPTPGLTRAQQWVIVSPDLELLDTPGIMQPNLGTDPRAPLTLGLLNLLKHDLIADELLAEFLHHLLLTQERLPALLAHYQLADTDADFPRFLPALATRLGLLLPGATPDLPTAATRLLRDFRDGALGPLSLEAPPA